MRKIALVKNDPVIKRVMIYDCDEGCYLFLYDRNNDGPAYADCFFLRPSDAQETCATDYGITEKEWQIIDDPMEHCLHDMITPVRIVGRDEGKPQWGNYETLTNGAWITCDPRRITENS